MYICITGSKNNKDVYIKQSYRKESGKTSSRIYRKLGKFNDLLARFDGDKDKMMAWAKEEAAKDTAAYNKQKEKVSVQFSPDLCQDTFTFKQDEQLFILPVSSGATRILFAERLPCTFGHGPGS